jgi:hypothetical protein
MNMLALIDRCARRKQVGSVYIRRRNKTECSVLCVCVCVCVLLCVWYREHEEHNLPYPLYNLLLLLPILTVTRATYEAMCKYCGTELFYTTRNLVSDSTFSTLTSTLHCTSLPERSSSQGINLRVKTSKESSFPMGKGAGACSSSPTFKHRVIYLYILYEYIQMFQYIL